MTTVLRIATLLFLIICPKLGQADDIPLCCLCQGCSFAIAGRGDVFVDSMGKTCNDLILEMADDENSSTHGSSECRRLQNLHHDRCCNPNHTPTPIPQNARSGALTGGINCNKYAMGSRWATCNLCRDGKPPGNLNTAVAVLNPTTGQQIPNVSTCRDLYCYGQRRNLEDRLCTPARNFFEEPCGCGRGGGSSSTNNNSNGGDDNEGGRSQLLRLLSQLWKAIFGG